MPSIARHHAEWLSLVEVSGPFLSMPVLMRVFPQGLDPHDPERTRLLRQAYEEWEDGADDPAIHTAWVEWVLEQVLELRSPRLRDALLTGQALPPELRASFLEHGETLQPDYALVNPSGRPDAGAPRLLVQVYPPTQDLERAVEGRRWKAPPATRMMELLHATGVRLGLVTNGERWMLVDAPRGETTGFASWYAAMWLEEPLTLRAFCTLLDAHRFFGVAEESTLGAMLTESASSQEEVTNQLGDQVRRAVEMLIQTIDRIDKDRGRALLRGVNEVELYNAALTVMMRLVFLFCAEERGLLLLGDEMYDRNYAISTLRAHLREAADQHGEEVLERRRDAWARLLATFRAVYGGVEHDRMRLRAYGGHLFDPNRYPFLEGRAAGTTWRDTPAAPLPIDNRTVLHLLEALQMLQVKVPGGGPAEARRLSFRALDIEQIGHVYEGLLDHTAKRATQPTLGLESAAKKGVAPGVEIALAELERVCAKGETALLDFLKEQTGRSASALANRLAIGPDLADLPRVLAACDNDDALYRRVLPFAGLLRLDTFERPVVIGAGSVYVTTGADRRSTGTHYTPKSLTEPMVQHTLDPLVYVGPAEGRNKDDWQLRSARALLELKICDLAMGSGAFLVQTARYLAERLMEAWEASEAQIRARGVTAPQITPDGALSSGDPTETLIPHDARERQALALRLICDRCLYGVDKNPMAVEMAKLSLWLVTLDKDRPFTFLDHALRCGDSLLGISDVRQLRQWTLQPADDGVVRQSDFLTPLVARALSIALDKRRQIEAAPALSVADVQAKERLLREAEQAMALVKLGADLLVGSALAPDARTRETRRQQTLGEYATLMTIFQHQDEVVVYPSEQDEAQRMLSDLRARATELLGANTPFHWPLEFPEVFVEVIFTPDVMNGQLIPSVHDWEPPAPGFAAIIGNPPFIGGKRITGALGTQYREYLVDTLASGARGSADLCAYFFLRVGQLLRAGGDAGLLATNTIAQGDTREVGLDQLVAQGFSIPRAVPTREWPGDASVQIAHVWLRRGDWRGPYALDNQLASGITAYLTAPGEINSNPHRLIANESRSFIGSLVLGMGFVLEPEEAQALLAKDPRNRDVLFPYLNGEDLNSRPDQSPSRWVINFHDWPLARAETYPDTMAIVREKVKPERDKLGLKNDASAKGYARFWWQYARKGLDLHATIAGMQRVLVRARVSNINSIAFVPTGTICSEATVVFASADYGFFALLQALTHTEWLTFHASSMRTDIRYTPSDCFETFPFPDDISGLDNIGERYYAHRQSIMFTRQEGLTKTYNRFHHPQEAAEDIQRLRALHVGMDQAVARAYGWDDLDLGHGFHATKQGLRYTISEAARREVLGRLLRLNHERHAEEVAAGLVDESGKPLRGSKGKSRPVAGGSVMRGGSGTGGADVTETAAAYRAPRLFGEE
ncbi:MAG TPA: type IIL restriction-modification enzyme MmeI [Ktedonobacterales bacterium]|nr:type IIL restriction-modification enzyme MmeI [Ktedonobacterales bacterium]